MSIITRIWKEQPGTYFFLCTKDRAGNWRDHPFRRSQFKEIDAFLTTNADKDLYWCVHGFSKHRRLKKYAEPPKLLWADMDESDPREAPEFLPSIAIESSPGRFYGVWRLTDFMTEDVNRRLTYHLKADPGGWDLTQVIRVPGTKNFKYESTPRVKLMWMDGPSYSLDEIEKKLPRERKAKDNDVARGLYRKYEKHFSGWVRRTLMRGKPQPGKRSEVLWKLTNEMLEAGCTAEEAFELLRVSPWNKFIKRRDGDEQLKREIDKATKQHIAVVDDEKPREEVDRSEDEADLNDDDEEDEYRFLARSMAEVEEEKLEWLWYPYLARGEVSILEGDPGLGKSYLAQMAVMHLADGKSLPSVKQAKQARPVDAKIAYFDIENSAGSVTKRRLMDNGAEKLHNFYQEQEPFTIDDDETLDRVYDAIDKLRPAVVVFDTLNTYLGSVDTHNSAETQQTFKRFIDIARRFSCAVLVLRHLTKTSKGVTALYRGQGSIAFSGLARVVMTVGRHPEDPDLRVMAVTKINVARTPKALTYSIEEIPSLKDDDRSRFKWGEFVDLTADQILQVPMITEDDGLDEVCSWLRESLEDGALRRSKLLGMGEARSYTEKDIDKAANALRVIRGDDDMWALPEEEEKAS